MGGRAVLAAVVALGVALSSFGATGAGAAALGPSVTPVALDGGKTVQPTALPGKTSQPATPPMKGRAASVKEPATRPASLVISPLSAPALASSVTLPPSDPKQQLPIIGEVQGAGGSQLVVRLADGSISILPASLFDKSGGDQSECIRDTLVALRQLSPSSSTDALVQAATTICQRQGSK